MTDIELCEQYKLKQQLLFGYHKMEFDYVDDKVKLMKFNESYGDSVVNIPDFVRLLGQNVFTGCIAIHKVTAKNVEGRVKGVFSDFKGERLDLSEFNTSKVTYMRHMFAYCTKLKSINLSGFDTSKVTDMAYMFEYCTKLKSINLSGFDTSKVTDMRRMLTSCIELESLDLSHFNTSQVTDMGGMFRYCNELESLDLSGFDTSKVTDMNSMFYGSGIQLLDLSHFNTSQVTDMNNMFGKCSAVTLINKNNEKLIKYINKYNRNIQVCLV